MDVKHIAFNIAFKDKRSPLTYEQLNNEQLILKIKELSPNASTQECLDAITKVRKLCDDVYEVCDSYRDGKFGTDPLGVKTAIIELSKRDPGFSATEYDTAFSVGLLWTAF
ncbi:MAG: hypothetical protein WCQ53_03935 [bacterium]